MRVYSELVSISKTCKQIELNETTKNVATLSAKFNLIYTLYFGWSVDFKGTI